MPQDLLIFDGLPSTQPSEEVEHPELFVPAADTLPVNAGGVEGRAEVARVQDGVEAPLSPSFLKAPRLPNLFDLKFNPTPSGSHAGEKTCPSVCSFIGALLMFALVLSRQTHF
ncbi:hypothetical protein E8E15_001436 [Penicillium rubens]|nr:hypothetical protein E8E15_001436 [Penicillium rubens]